MPNHYDELIADGRVEHYTASRGHYTLALMLGRQEARNHAVGLNVQLTEAVNDLETTFSENRNNVDARLDHLTTDAHDCGHLLRENQLELHNAHKRGVSTIVHMLFFLTCIVACIVFNFGWVHYMEAINAQERADAETARVAYLKKLWPVKAYFMCDWVMTVSYAGYRRFLWNWFF